MFWRWLKAKISDYRWWFFTKEAKCYRQMWSIDILGYPKNPDLSLAKISKYLKYQYLYHWNYEIKEKNVGISEIIFKKPIKIDAKAVPHLIDIGMGREGN